MIKNDYILKIIEGLAILVAKIIGLKTSGNYEEAIETTDDAIKKLLGLNPEAVGMLSYEDLMAMLYTDKNVGAVKAIVLAKLVKEKAGILNTSGKDGYGLYLKSFNIYLSIALSDDENLNKYTKEINEFYFDIFKDKMLPNNTMHMLFKYFESTGRFSNAEDILFNLLDEGDYGVINEGIEFYNRLLKIDPQKLCDGNLPIDEVKDGLNKLKKMNI